MKKQSQNKPNFREAQMNATIFIRRNYENNSALRLWENKPNQSQSQNRSLPCEAPSFRAKRGQTIDDGRRNVREQSTDYGSLPAGGATEDRLSSGHDEQLWHAPIPKTTIKIPCYLSPSYYIMNNLGLSKQNCN